MKATHIKNIVIWALVVVNVFFLGFWLVGLAADYGEKIEMQRDLKTLLAQNGIQLDIRNIQEGGELYTLESYRNTAREQAMAEALLGPTAVTEQGGNKYSYTGPDGQAVFATGGEFQIKLNNGAISAEAGAESTVRRVLGLMKIEAEPDTVAGSSGNETVTAIGMWNKSKIFNYRIRFAFNDGSLREISGTFAPDIRQTAEKTDMTSCATALLSFLGDVRKERYSCSEILEIQPGYRLTVSVGGLDPIWRIATNSGIFYVDALDGSVEPASE